jgi:cytochrome c oxidase subunit II
LKRAVGALFAVLLVTGCMDQGVMAPASPEARLIADLGWFMFIVAALVMGLVLALLAWALVRGRREREPGGSDVRLVVLGGLALPAVVLPVVWFLSLPAMAEIASVDGPFDLEVNVTARNWSYEMHYPASGVVVRDELRLPLDQRVLLRVTSTDVIHSFWVPELGGKRDMVPGRVTELTIRPTRAGTFEARCAEFCGVGHTSMRMRVLVVPRDELDLWLADNSPAASPPAEGQPEVPAG